MRLRVWRAGSVFERDSSPGRAHAARPAILSLSTPASLPPAMHYVQQMVEMASAKFVCIVDDSKMVDGLGGSKLAMPVEIVQVGVAGMAVRGDGGTCFLYMPAVGAAQR